MRCHHCHYLTDALYESPAGLAVYGLLCSGCFFELIGRRPLDFETIAFDTYPWRRSLEKSELFGDWL